MTPQFFSGTIGLIAIAVAACAQTIVSDNPFFSDATVRYVAANGSNTFNGDSWLTAKASVAAAINSLPVTGENPPIHHGTVYIGPGTYVETATPIEFNAYLHLVCASSGDGSFPTGSVIQLGSGRNTPLFSYTPQFAQNNGYAHFIVVDDCTFDGNSANNPAAPDLIRIYNGGFRTVFNRVGFQNATSYALRLENQAVNFACYSCTWGGVNGGALYLNSIGGGNMVSVYESQIDNSGPDPIYIKQLDTGGSNVLTFVNLKTEATVGATTHTHVIRFSPPPGGGHPMGITVVGLSTVKTVANGGYAIYEENQPGYGANWDISSVNAPGYTAAFHSAKTGQTSAGIHIKHLIAGVPFAPTGAVYDYTPDLELSGGPALLTGVGSPQGNVSANVGALYLRTDGGTSSTLYVKESGSGNTGWVAK